MGNLHRNILFRDTENLPEFPFSYFDSQKPEELWNWRNYFLLAHRADYWLLGLKTVIFLIFHPLFPLISVSKW